MERKAILDQYFDDIGVEKVEESQIGWEMIKATTLGAEAVEGISRFYS